MRTGPQSPPCFRDCRWEISQYLSLFFLKKAKLIYDLQNLLKSFLIIDEAKKKLLKFDNMKQTNWTQMFNKKVQIRLYYCVIVLQRIDWKPSLKLMCKQKINLNKVLFVLSLLSIWVQFVCFIFVCFMMQKYAVVKAYLCDSNWNFWMILEFLESLSMFGIFQ